MFNGLHVPIPNQDVITLSEFELACDLFDLPGKMACLVAIVICVAALASTAQKENLVLKVNNF
jgi:hypothetical protein